jgi:hypothetical protein
MNCIKNGKVKLREQFVGAMVLDIVVMGTL